jgi:hypothetical protein
MRLDTLSPDERFEVTGMPVLKGIVLHIGSAGVRVKYDGSDQKREVKDKIDGTVLAEFTAPGKPVLISGGTEVTKV